MTPEEFALQYFEETEKSILALASVDQWLDCIKAYARHMCDQQKEECSDSAEISDGGDWGSCIDSETILNAPYPKELQ